MQINSPEESTFDLGYNLCRYLRRYRIPSDRIRTFGTASDTKQQARW